MARTLTLRLCLAALLGMAAVAFADIRTTPHSLVRKSTKADASDVCVFCHTPNVTGTPPTHAPLWQRSIGTNLVFTIYDDIGRLGLGKTSVGSQSIACLSCHDSNQARAVSKTSADHPFGVPYRGATKNHGPWASQAAVVPEKSKNETPAIRAKHLAALEDFRDVSQGVVEGRTVWWVSSLGASGRRTRSDLPLYGRNHPDTGENLPFIECSSCHDPHTDNSKFLRQSLNGSQLCLTCHIK